MAYSNSKPQPTDKLRVSQNDILNNFIALKTTIDTNHVTFDMADTGKHKFISFPEQLADPALAVNEVQFYAKNSTLSTEAELFLRREDGTIYEITSAGKAVTGWTRLPSGILIKWGNTSATGLATITFPVVATIPAFTTVYSIQLVPIAAGAVDADIAVRLVSFIAASFDVYCTARTTVADKLASFEYLAIGI